MLRQLSLRASVAVRAQSVCAPRAVSLFSTGADAGPSADRKPAYKIDVDEYAGMSEALKRTLDLGNASMAMQRKAAEDDFITKFQDSPTDTGSSKVQSKRCRARPTVVRFPDVSGFLMTMTAPANRSTRDLTPPTLTRFHPICTAQLPGSPSASRR